jgi:hypothetical protein
MLISQISKSQYQTFFDFCIYLPDDSITKVILDPINNNLKKATVVDNGNIKVFCTDVMIASKYVNNVTTRIDTLFKQKTKEYIVNKDDKLVKLNYKNLKKMIPKNSPGYIELKKAKRHRYKKIASLGLIGVGGLYVANNIISNKYLHYKKETTLQDGLIGVGIILTGLSSAILNKSRNNIYLYDAILTHNYYKLPRKKTLKEYIHRGLIKKKTEIDESE